MAFPLAALAGAAAGMGGGGGGMNPAAALTGLSSAAGALTGKFTEIVNTASRFVAAFDPNIVAQLNRAFRELDATVGIALRPIVAAAIDIVRGFGGAINGIMRELQPIVAKVADSFANALQPWIDNLAEGFAALMPIFDIFADAIAGISDLVSTWMRAVRPFITMIIELGKQLAASIFGTNVGDQVKGLFTQIKDAMQSFVKNLLLAVASFLKLIGATQTLDAFIRGTKPRPVDDIRGNLAPQNAAFASLADMAKNMTLAIFTATAQGKEKKTQEDFLAGIQSEMEAIRNGEMVNLSAQAQAIFGILTDVHKAIVDVWNKLPSKEAVLSAGNEAAMAGGSVAAGATFLAGLLKT